MRDELMKALTPEGQKFLEICGKAMVVFDPVDCPDGNDLPLLTFLIEITEYEKLSAMVLNAEQKEDALCELTDIIRDVSLAVGFVLGQELDITVPEAQKCLRAIKKVMKDKQAIHWMAREKERRMV